ncbi:hypothetical protein C8Q78DRAFT_237185 [Trametes maxima]|nr:hypothetical protein C8Q78DRAFT_237185 [Trametes maxima]
MNTLALRRLALHAYQGSGLRLSLLLLCVDMNCGRPCPGYGGGSGSGACQPRSTVYQPPRCCQWKAPGCRAVGGTLWYYAGGAVGLSARNHPSARWRWMQLKRLAYVALPKRCARRTLAFLFSRLQGLFSIHEVLPARKCGHDQPYCKRTLPSCTRRRCGSLPKPT